jgi:hypothetical protein
MKRTSGIGRIRLGSSWVTSWRHDGVVEESVAEVLVLSGNPFLEAESIMGTL